MAEDLEVAAVSGYSQGLNVCSTLVDGKLWLANRLRLNWSVFTLGNKGSSIGRNVSRCYVADGELMRLL